MIRLSTRVRDASAQRTLLALPNPFQRLCVQLLLLSRHGKTPLAALDPAPTHQELAIMINTSRETVTRCFQVLLTRQAIGRDGLVLEIIDGQYVAGVASGKIDAPKV